MAAKTGESGLPRMVLPVLRYDVFEHHMFEHHLGNKSNSKGGLGSLLFLS